MLLTQSRQGGALFVINTHNVSLRQDVFEGNAAVGADDGGFIAGGGAGAMYEFNAGVNSSQDTFITNSAAVRASCSPCGARPC